MGSGTAARSGSCAGFPVPGDERAIVEVRLVAGVFSSWLVSRSMEPVSAWSGLDAAEDLRLSVLAHEVMES